MQRNRKEERIEKSKIKKYEDANGNNINVHINVGHNENDESDNSNQIEIPQTTKIIEDRSEINSQDELVSKLKFEIKKFNQKKEQLINSKIDIPNDIFNLPDIELNSNQDIIKYTDIIRSKILLLEQLIISSKGEKIIPKSTPIQNIPSNNNFQTFSRNPFDYMYQPRNQFGSRIGFDPITQQPIVRNPIRPPIIPPVIPPVVPPVVQPIDDASGDEPAPEVQPIDDASGDEPAPDVEPIDENALTENQSMEINDFNNAIEAWEFRNADLQSTNNAVIIKKEYLKIKKIYNEIMTRKTPFDTNTEFYKQLTNLSDNIPPILMNLTKLTPNEQSILNDFDMELKKWEDDNDLLQYSANKDEILGQIDRLRDIIKKMDEYQNDYSKDYDFYKELKKTKTNINKRIKVFEKQIEEIKKGNLPEFPPNIDPDIDRPGDEEDIPPEEPIEPIEPIEQNPDEFTEGNELINTSRLSQINERLGELRYFKNNLIKTTAGRSQGAHAIILQENKNLIENLKKLKTKIETDSYTIEEFERNINKQTILDYSAGYGPANAFRTAKADFKTSSIIPQYGDNATIRLEKINPDENDGKYKITINSEEPFPSSVFNSEGYTFDESKDIPLPPEEDEERKMLLQLEQNYCKETKNQIQSNNIPNEPTDPFRSIETYRCYIEGLGDYLENNDDNLEQTEKERIQELIETMMDIYQSGDLVDNNSLIRDDL